MANLGSRAKALYGGIAGPLKYLAWGLYRQNSTFI